VDRLTEPAAIAARWDGTLCRGVVQLKKIVVPVVLVVVALSMGLALLVVVVTGSGAEGTPTTGGTGGTGGGSAGSAAGGVGPGTAIPATWVSLYQQAASTCPGLSWSVLAAIGTVETDSGQSTAVGVWSGANGAGAEGPMQFEPSTFSAYATVGPEGTVPASPYDPVDAVYTAAAMLCADGAGTPSSLRSAVEDYNHSDVYANTVLALSLAFQANPTTSGTVIAAISFAAEQLNTPYLWGGTGTGGFDCSGLVQAAYRRAGISLPRVAQSQFDAGPAVTSGTSVEPGDLVFFGTGPNSVDHVGLYVGAGEMIDAPHTGALVRFDNADWSDLAGATRPAA
jgi:cell wall-associated NlpC family hydrolase